jgi:anti-sigma-K factor RskA
MQLSRHPELLDRIAASYALGTLRGRARRRFEAMARQSAAVRACAILWQERLAAMTELQPGEAPDPNVWKRIENLIAAQRPRPAAQPAPHIAPTAGARAARGGSGWWRGAALAGGLATVAAVAVGLNLDSRNSQLAAQLAAQPVIEYVAVLSDEQSSASMLVTFDPRRNTLTLKRIGGFQEAADKSLQLWALPPTGGPKSLGVVDGGPVVKLTAQENEVVQAPALAITLEPRGGVTGGPTGPVLFKGPLIQAPV